MLATLRVAPESWICDVAWIQRIALGVERDAGHRRHAQPRARCAGSRRHHKSSFPEPRAASRAWRGWRAPDLPRSEHRGTLVISRRIKRSLRKPGDNYIDTHR